MKKNKLTMMQPSCEMLEALKKLQSGELEVEKGRKIKHDLKEDYPVVGTARMIFDYAIKGRITDKLYNDLYDLLRGFNEDVQLEMAEAIIDFISDRWTYTTNLKAVDILLPGIYARLREQLDNPEKFGLLINE
ncbi:MAG: hypothetical protein ACI3YQ_05645 [Prevotella sp.]